jgi:NAD(P)H-nitrite reductase large subunit
MRYVIIGVSAAGISAAETIRKHDSKCEIVMVSEEESPLYSRPLISYYLAGKLSEADLAYRARDFFEKNHIQRRLGVLVVGLDPRTDSVHLSTGETLGYDRLLVATGAAPKLPEIEGIQKPDVFGFRTLQDAQGILNRLPHVQKAVVLGGGLVGLKAACGLAARGVEVIVAADSPRILSQMMNDEAAAVYEDLFEDRGIHIRTRMTPVEVLGQQRVTGVRFADGTELRCQLVVIGKGVEASMELINGTEIECDHGILVDEHCRTNVENIYAAGDVAQTMDVVRGEKWTNALWPCAVEQGRIAGLNMVGQEVVYQGSMGMNSVQFLDLPVISAGLVGLREKNYDEEIVQRPSRWVYKRLLLKARRVVGFVLVGEVEQAGLIRLLMSKQVDASAIKDDVLEKGFNFARVLNLVLKQPEKFTEPEYQELRETMETVLASKGG